MIHKNKTQKYPVDTACQNVSCLLLRLNPDWKNMQFQLHRRFKHRQRTKINKIMLSASPSSIFHTKFTISVLKSKQIFHPNSNRTRIASIGILNWVSNFYVRTDSENKFHKMGIRNWLPIGFNLEVITTTQCSTTNGESSQVFRVYFR